MVPLNILQTCIYNGCPEGIAFIDQYMYRYNVANVGYVVSYYTAWSFRYRDPMWLMNPTIRPKPRVGVDGRGAWEEELRHCALDPPLHKG